MTIKVINAGFGRTGTMSIKLALEQLGFGPCHHMEEVFKNPEQLPFWQRAADGESVDWSEIFQGYNSAVDWPSAHYWEQLAAYYPQAKVLLSIRSAESWWESYSDTIKALIAIRDEIPEEYPRAVAGMAEKIVNQQTFSGDPDNKALALAKFQQRMDDVKATIPADRLLIYQVSEGWQPLCQFLDVPVPNTEFPRSNAKEAFWEAFSGGVEN